MIATRHEVDCLVRAQREAEAFTAAQGWRRPEINRLREQLAEQSATTIISCARAGDPLAYGTDPLHHAAHHRHHTLQRLEASIPADRSAELNQVTAALARTTAARDQAVGPSRRRPGLPRTDQEPALGPACPCPRRHGRR